jgi:hypothetical protein
MQTRCQRVFLSPRPDLDLPERDPQHHNENNQLSDLPRSLHNLIFQALIMSYRTIGRIRSRKVPMDMRTKGRHKKKMKPKIDYLTNLPHNILLRITSNLPMSSFLALSQAHSHLRWFMHRYASTICNLNIQTQFPKEAKILEAAYIEGWLTPTGGLAMIKPKHVAKWVDPGLRLLLSQPGPQFLYFLQKRILKFSSDTTLIVEFKAMQEFLDSLNEESPVVYGGKDYPRWCWLKEMIWYHGVPS